MADPISNITEEAAWPDAKLIAGALQIQAEQRRRTILRVAEDQVTQQQAELLDARDRRGRWSDPDAGDTPAVWVQPTGAHDAYPMGRSVSRGGLVYESLIPNNTTMPGDPADPQSYRWWRKIEPTQPPASGPGPWDPNGHEYKTNDLLTFQSQTYRVRQDHVSQPDWPPHLVAALYAVVTP